MSKLITCKLCTHEISSSAETCRNCGHNHQKDRNQINDYKTYILLGIILIIVVVLKKFGFLEPILDNFIQLFKK